MYQRINSGFGRRLGLAAVSVVLFSVSSCGGDDGGSAANFCEVATRVDEGDALKDAFTGGASPDVLKSAMEQLVKDAESMKKSAPDEISEEVSLVAESMTAFADALAEGDYDMAQVIQSPEFAELGAKFEGPEYTEAGEKLDEYLATECGITSGS